MAEMAPRAGFKAAPIAVSGVPAYWSLVPAAIVVAALYFGRPVLLPLAVAILLAFAISPLVAYLRRIGCGRTSSVLIASFLALSVLGGMGFFIASQTAELADELPLYQNNLIEKIDSIRGQSLDASIVGRAAELLNTLRQQLSGINKAPPGASASSPRPPSQPVPVEITKTGPAPLEIAATLARPLLGFLAATGIIIIFVVFILLHKEDIRDRFIRLAGARDMQKTTLLLDDGAERLGHYLLTQAAINAAFGACMGLGLWIIGIPSAFLWGFIVTILRFVPYLGVPLAAAFPVILALSVDAGWSKAIWTISLFTIGEFFIGQVVEPWLFGRRMGLSSLAVVVAATFWAWLWGPVGLLLSTPLTMCLVVLGRHVDHLRFLDVLLGDRPALEPEEALYIRLLGEDADEAAAEAESYLKENSLCSYYDEVVLKALALGYADMERGALDHERALKIRDTTLALIENLSDIEPAPKALEKPQGEAGEKAAVLCIGGRGPFDEAAALLLVDLLHKAHIDARLATKTETLAGDATHPTVSGAAAFCVCYLNAGNLVSTRYLLRRIKRRLPQSLALAAFWGAPLTDSHAWETMPCDVVTKLDVAVQVITQAIHCDLRESENRERLVPLAKQSDATAFVDRVIEGRVWHREPKLVPR